MPTMLFGRWRVQIPPAIIAVALSPGLTARVRQIIGDTVAVPVARTLHDAAVIVRTTRSACVLLTVPGALDLDAARDFRRFRDLYPHVPAVALFVEGLSSHRGTLDLGESGLTDIVRVDADVNATALTTALGRANSQGISHRVWDEIQPRIPDALVTLLKTAIRVGEAPLTTRGLADAAGVPERSLRKLCEDARIPSPQWIIGWARLLLAAHYLDERGRTIQEVAELLGYSSSCALRNQLRRYTGQSPRRLRASGVTRSLCTALEHSVAYTATRATRSPARGGASTVASGG